jgi:hypothetical protein
VLWALLDTDRQEAWSGAFEESLHDAFAAYERWTAYALRGSNGRSERTGASGLLAWRVEGLTALPVDDGPGDPHLHARIAIAAMVRCQDGVWRQAADGGTDFYRHAAAFDALLQARFRALTAAGFGVSWERDPASGAWEIAGVPAAVRGAFSRRTAQIDDAAGPGASREDKLRAAAATARARTPDHGLAELRALWRQRAGQIVADVDAMVAAVAPGGGTCGGPRLPGLQDITASVIQHHLELADAAWFDTAQATAAVADYLPDGIGADCDLTLLSRAVLASAGAVPISSSPPLPRTPTPRATSRALTALPAAAGRDARTLMVTHRRVVPPSGTSREEGQGSFPPGGKKPGRRLCCATARRLLDRC